MWETLGSTPNRTCVIGLNGGIGAGKSTVLQILEEDYDAYVIQADQVAHRLMEPGGPTYEKLLEVFGKEILGADERINRKVLAGIIFSDEESQVRVNAIVHPLVREAILAEVSEAMYTHPYVVIEAALLFEGGLIPYCDIVWCVYAKREVRIRRLMEGRGYTKEYCEQVIASQKSDEDYQSESDIVIDNSGTRLDTAAQIERWIHSLAV